MLNAFLVALAVFICVGGAELIGFTMLNRPIVIGPLVGLFLGDLHTGVIIGASLEAVFMGVVNIGGASAAEPGIATAVGTAFAIMLGKGSEVALTLALPIGILGLQIKTVLYIFIVGMFAKTFDRLAAEGKDAFALDSKTPDMENYMDFLNGEVRYNSLQRQNPEKAARLFAKNESEAKARYAYLNKLVAMYGEEE